MARAGAARHRRRCRRSRARRAGASTRRPTPQKLTDIYRGLGTRFSTKKEKQEVTSAFAGGALVLLVAGMAAAMARGGRLP